MKIHSRPRPHKTSGEKLQIIESYESGGLSLRECAAQHGICASTLQRWLNQHRAGPAAGRADFIEVPNLLGTKAGLGHYRLHFPRGLVLELARGFQPEEVRALAQLLQSL